MITQSDMLTMEELKSEAILTQTKLLYNSYQNMFIDFPIHFSDFEDLAIKIYFAPFIVASIDNNENPKYNYLNFCAQKAFEINRDNFFNYNYTDSIPEKLLSTSQGFINNLKTSKKLTDYNGMRISKNGNTFRLNNSYVWLINDNAGDYKGVAWMDSLF